MSRLIGIILMALFLQPMAQMTWGQEQEEDRNAVFKVAIGEFSYTPKQKKENVGSVLGAVGEALLLGKTTQRHDNYNEAVRASIVKGISGVRRFNAIDGAFQEGEVQEGMKALYVDGTILNVSTATQIETHTDAKKKTYTTTYYKATIGVTVNVKDATNDFVINSQTFNVSDYDLSWVETTEGAINNALSVLSGQITRFYNRFFPLNAFIIERGNEKKDKQQEVYIDLGGQHGAYSGMHLTVYSVKTIAGRYARKELGKLKIKDVMGDDISLCKVTSGGKNIKAALDEEQTVVAVTTD